MSLLVTGALLCVGLALLIGGGNLAVGAASALAERFGVSTFFVGATLVAVGSSLPEIATSAYAAAYGAGDLVIGHIVGSATSQITLGLGIVALASPLTMSRTHVRVYGFGMLAAMTAMLAAVWSGVVTRPEGLLMMAAYLGFLATRSEDETLQRQVESHRGDGDDRSARRRGAELVVGLALVIVGGHVLVTSATTLAAALAVPRYLLGLVTGLGRTAPEIAISLVAVRHHDDPIAIGTLFGSNITDPLFSLGVGAAIGGVTVVNRPATMASIGYMLAASALVLAWCYWRGGIGRVDGVGVALLYAPSFVLA